MCMFVCACMCVHMPVCVHMCVRVCWCVCVCQLELLVIYYVKLSFILGSMAVYHSFDNARKLKLDIFVPVKSINTIYG